MHVKMRPFLVVPRRRQRGGLSRRHLAPRRQQRGGRPRQRRAPSVR